MTGSGRQWLGAVTGAWRQWLGARLQARDSPLEVKVAAARVLAAVAVGSSEEGLRTLESLRRVASPPAPNPRPGSASPPCSPADAGPVARPSSPARHGDSAGPVTSSYFLPRTPVTIDPAVPTRGLAAGVRTSN